MKREFWPLSEKVVYKKEVGELLYHDERFIILSARMLPIIHQTALNTIGSIAHSIVYQACFKSGCTYAKKLLKGLDKNIDKKEIVQKSLESLTQFGFGKVQVIELKEEKKKLGTFRLYECCYAPFYNIREHACYIVAGIAAGMISAILGKKVNAHESLCILTGDPFCEFEVRLG